LDKHKKEEFVSHFGPQRTKYLGFGFLLSVFIVPIQADYAKFQLSTSYRSGLVLSENIQKDPIFYFGTSRAKFSGFRIFAIGLGRPSTSLPNLSFLPHLKVG
jgi:hypothetical protein